MLFHLKSIYHYGVVVGNFLSALTFNVFGQKVEGL